MEIYTDGAYSSSRNQGGWAFVVLDDNNEKIHHDFGGVLDTTNNRMEILAVMKAIKWAKTQNLEEITIYLDSMYVIGTMTKNWKRNKNKDLWREMDEISKSIYILYKHVKGHKGDKYNELCDSLAVEGSHIKLN